MRPTGYCEIYIWSLNAPPSDRLIGSETDIYRHKQDMFAIIAVRPNVILGQQYLFSPQIEPSIFIFW
jgi:hypothetical protein